MVVSPLVRPTPLKKRAISVLLRVSPVPCSEPTRRRLVTSETMAMGRRLFQNQRLFSCKLSSSFIDLNPGAVDSPQFGKPLV